MVFYVILVIASFFLDEEKIESLKKRGVGHIIISVAILVVTIFSFYSIDGLKTKEKTKNFRPTIQQWKVALPYIDQTLNRNFNVKEEPIKSIYIVTVNAQDRNAAILEAKKKFLSENGPKPFLKNAEKTPYLMFTLEYDSIVENVENNTSNN